METAEIVALARGLTDDEWRDAKLKAEILLLKRMRPDHAPTPRVRELTQKQCVALLAYVQELAEGLSVGWRVQLGRLAANIPVGGTSELTRLCLVRWTRDAGGSVEVTPLGRAVLRELER